LLSDADTRPPTLPTAQRVLLLCQSAKALDILQTYCKLRHGTNSYVRIDNATPAAERYQAVQRFNAPDAAASGCCFFLATPKCCGLGTELPSVGSVVLYDSDWHPRLDMQALNRAWALGKDGKVAVYRWGTAGGSCVKFCATAGAADP
jgi:SNF2 family DNA or RNA helicase